MKLLFITFILLSFLLFSCKKEDNSHFVDLASITIDSIWPSVHKMQEIQNPMAMHLFQNHLIFVNIDPNADAPFYIYSPDSLVFENSYGKFGRGVEEFLDLNPYYWHTTDSSFLINTNYYYQTELTFKGDSLTCIRNSVILDRVVNNLSQINDTLFVFERKMEKEEYALYNSPKQQIIDSFSTFPKASIPYENLDDRDNILQKSCVTHPDLPILAAFYLNEPLIRFYDLRNQSLKEIRLGGIQQKEITVDEFYEDKGKLYFLLPHTTSKSIFVLFLGTASDESFQQQSTELQEWDWQGNLKKRYAIQYPIDLYCVSNDGNLFYGLQTREENFKILKAHLISQN